MQVLVKDDGMPPVPVIVHINVKVMHCRYGCGQRYLVSKQTKNLPGCLGCAIAAMVECQRQMRLKSGPYYERWKAAVAASGERWATGCKLAAERYARGGGPS